MGLVYTLFPGNATKPRSSVCLPFQIRSAGKKHFRQMAGGYKTVAGTANRITVPVLVNVPLV